MHRRLRTLTLPLLPVLFALACSDGGASTWRGGVAPPGAQTAAAPTAAEKAAAKVLTGSSGFQDGAAPGWYRYEVPAACNSDIYATYSPASATNKVQIEMFASDGTQIATSQGPFQQSSRYVDPAAIGETLFVRVSGATETDAPGPFYLYINSPCDWAGGAAGAGGSGGWASAGFAGAGGFWEPAGAGGTGPAGGTSSGGSGPAGGTSSGGAASGGSPAWGGAAGASAGFGGASAGFGGASAGFGGAPALVEPAHSQATATDLGTGFQSWSASATPQDDWLSFDDCPSGMTRSVSYNSGYDSRALDIEIVDGAGTVSRSVGPLDYELLEIPGASSSKLFVHVRWAGPVTDIAFQTYISDCWQPGGFAGAGGSWGGGGSSGASGGSWGGGYAGASGGWWGGGGSAGTSGGPGNTGGATSSGGSAGAAGSSSSAGGFSSGGSAGSGTGTSGAAGSAGNASAGGGGSGGTASAGAAGSVNAGAAGTTSNAGTGGTVASAGTGGNTTNAGAAGTVGSGAKAGSVTNAAGQAGATSSTPNAAPVASEEGGCNVSPGPRGEAPFALGLLALAGLAARRKRASTGE